MLETGTLLLVRARAAGSVGRPRLEDELARVDVGSVAGWDEVLLVPRLRMLEAPSAGRPSGEFASHVTERLRIMRDAARIDPAGLVPGALALRFTSRARYASWLVAAWLAGPEGATHEARTLLPPPASIRRWVARAILPHGPELVLLAGELRARRLLVRWFARLDPRQTGAIRQTLRRDYLLPEEAEPTAGRQVPVGSSDPQSRITDQEPRSGLRQPLPPASPLGEALAQDWADLVSTEPQALTLDPPRAQLLLTLATLARRPNLGRHLGHEALGQAMAKGSRAAELSPLSEAPPAPARPPHQPAEMRKRYARAARMAAVSPAAPHRPAGGEREESSVPLPAAQNRPGTVPVPERRRDVTASYSTATVEPNADPATPEARQCILETSFGGVFFVLNILLACGFYPDFTRPRDRGLGPSPFWLLDRIAHRMFGREYGRDPLSAWLGDTGLGGALPEAWRVDPQWLRHLPSGQHAFRSSRSRTVLWDLRGFALCDVAGRLDRAKLLEFYAPLGETVCHPRLVKRAMPRDRDRRWIACLTEFLAARIALAGDGLSIASLKLPAQVTLRQERIEVIFGLADLPIELRIAGLDRDPGWLPSEGRSVYFLFE